MNAKILGAALFVVTAGAVAVYPSIQTSVPPVESPIKQITNPTPIDLAQAIESQAVIDVVFVLDTTSSMSGLIETAKEKIWSIATTMTSAQQTPNIRIGLVAFRDRGDAYVTKTVDLSSDIDSVYATLMDFKAQGGGDGPESVNKALYDAVHNISWSQDPKAYQVVFLFGDAPPHMDYQDEASYPEIIADANQKGIVINTIQCGTEEATRNYWRTMAQLSQGRYFQVEQAGSAVAYFSPYDEEMAKLSAKLDDTRLFYGSEIVKAKMEEKVASTDKLNLEASVSARARRGAFNASSAGRQNRGSDHDLVEAVVSGRADLNKIATDMLPASMQSMPVVEQQATIAKLANERRELGARLSTLR